MTIAASSHSNCLLIDPSDQRWQDFIKSQINATIFHYPAWIKLLEDSYGYRPFITAVCDETGNIRAGFPIMEINSLLTGRRLVSLPFTDYCNPLYDDLIQLINLSEGIFQLSKEKSISKVELRWNYPSNDLFHPISRYVLHTLKLDSDVEKVLKGVHRTQYQNVRRAEREDIKIERGNGLDDMRTFYKLQCLTRKRHGLPVQPWKFYELLYYQLLEKEFGFILLANQSERCLAAGIFLYAQKTLTYKFAASTNNEHQNFRANHLLTWNAICWGCKNGFKWFDFGRSDIEDTGLRTFKIRWGAEESALSYSYINDLPSQRTDSIFMPLMQYVIRKSPLWVGTAIGELIYKYFG
jgi:hypothetical protein